MSWLKRVPMLVGVLAVLVVATSALPVASAGAALGTQLASFIPQAGYEGRGLVVYGSTALLSTESSAILTEVNLATERQVGELATTASSGFGALAFDPSGNLWGAEYTDTGEDWIDQIASSGQATRQFDAAKEIDASLQNIDGLAFGADGTLWLKGEGFEKSETTIFKVSGETAEAAFKVAFGNSGIAMDGEHHLWLAEMVTASDAWGRKIREYDESGKELNSFTTPLDNGEEIHPESLAFDHCTFPGVLALWVYGANGVSSPLVAYEIGPYGGSTSDCPPPAKKEEQKKEEPAKTTETVGSGVTTTSNPASVTPSAPKPAGTSTLAGGDLLLEALAPGDPTGTLFVYVWQFGDGTSVSGHGRVNHAYKCAGVYHVSVTDIDTTGARHTSTSELTVGFPRSAQKAYRGLRFSPHVRVSGHKATLWVNWSGKGRHVRARSIDWKLDHQRGKRFGIHIHAVGKVALGRDHFMTAIVHFSNGHSTSIKTCFYA